MTEKIKISKVRFEETGLDVNCRADAGLRIYPMGFAEKEGAEVLTEILILVGYKSEMIWAPLKPETAERFANNLLTIVDICKRVESGDLSPDGPPGNHGNFAGKR